MPPEPVPPRWTRERLPAGRHGLTRSFVAHNQRERILGAVADAVRETGYVPMSVEDVLVRAGVSRRAFYEHFENKEDAFLQAYDAVFAQLNEHVTRAWASQPAFEAGVRAGLAAFLDFIARDPAFAHMCIVEVLAAGPKAIERRDGALRAFAALIDQGAEERLTGHDAPPPIVAETIVGGIFQLVYARVLRGAIAELPDLLPDLVYSALLPYVGREAARREYEALAAHGDGPLRRAV